MRVREKTPSSGGRQATPGVDDAGRPPFDAAWFGGPRAQRSSLEAERLRRRLALETGAMAAFLGVSERTYARRLSEGSLTEHESIRLDMLGETLREASRVFRDEAKAVRWLYRPIVSLDRLPPLAHLRDVQGYERVKRTLAKIEHGLY
jgi:putative toxin-antitoxin system antitoxin component (TIGR02293 family)